MNCKDIIKNYNSIIQDLINCFNIPSDLQPNNNHIKIIDHTNDTWRSNKEYYSLRIKLNNEETYTLYTVRRDKGILLSTDTHVLIISLTKAKYSNECTYTVFDKSKYKGDF